jgi:hypothetical protein
VSFGLGAKRSHPDKIARAAPAHEHPLIKAALLGHVSGTSPLPDEVDLDEFSPPVMDQGQSGACTAHAISGGIAGTMAAQGTPLGFVPSQDLQYKATRARERALVTAPGAPLPLLTDSGAEIADVIAVIAEDGVKPMAVPQTSDGRFSDVESDHVNDEPAVEGLEVAAQHVLDGPYAVDLTAANASDVLAAALASKMELDIAFFADTAFMNLGSGQVAQAPNESDQNGGGHSVRLNGYKKQADGTRRFRLRNSWGLWCEGGSCWVSEAFIAKLWEAWVVAVKAVNS